MIEFKWDDERVVAAWLDSDKTDVCVTNYGRMFFLSGRGWKLYAGFEDTP